MLEDYCGQYCLVIDIIVTRDFSRIAELARSLFTTPNYLLGFEEEKSEEQRMDEGIVAMLGRIQDDKIKKMLMIQIEAVLNAFRA